MLLLLLLLLLSETRGWIQIGKGYAAWAGLSV